MAREAIVREQSGRWLHQAEKLLVALTEERPWKVLSYASLGVESDHSAGLCLIAGLRHLAGVEVPADVGVVMVNLSALADRYLLGSAADVDAFSEVMLADVCRVAIHEAGHELSTPDRLERVECTPSFFRQAVAAPSKYPPGAPRPGHGAEWVRSYAILAARAVSGRGMEFAPWRDWHNSAGWRKAFRLNVEADLAAHTGLPGEAIADAALSDCVGRGPWHRSIVEWLASPMPVALSDIFSEAEHRSAAA